MARPVERLYLALAVAGAVLPYAILFGSGEAALLLRPGVFFALPFASTPAAVFSADVLWAALAFLIFAEVEGRRLAMHRRWISVLVTLTIGLCCALPLFLWRRERRLAA